MNFALWELAKEAGALPFISSDPDLAVALCHDAEALTEDLEQLFKPVDALLRHAARHGKVVEWARLWPRLVESAVSGQIPPGDLERFSRQCDAIYDVMQRGGWHDSILESIRRGSSRFLAASLAEEMSQDDHGPLVKALEKYFKVSVERHEPVSTGCYVYLDLDNTRKLLSQIKTGNEMREFLAKHQYHCLRRGNLNDFETCVFGDAVSQWLFVHLDDHPKPPIE